MSDQDPVDLTNRSREELVALGCATWDESGLMLLTPALLARAKPGTLLVGIDGRESVVGRDAIDGDTRYGLLVFHRDAPPRPPARVRRRRS